MAAPLRFVQYAIHTPCRVHSLLACTRGQLQRMLSRRMDKTPSRAAIFVALGLLSGRIAYSQESLESLQKRAEKGNAEAQTALGTKYRNGEGVRQDLEQAARWFRLAANQGSAEAENDLGFLYDYGGGLPIDHQEAARWYRKAADQGRAAAALNLAWLYDSG